MKHNIKILFICKIRNHCYGPSFGLINSCRFISCALKHCGIESEVVSVVDNNDIDREIHKHHPTHVFIEALWVVPEKFKELIPLHPNIEWYVRIHSKVPFLANEGMAIEWLREYYKLSKTYPKLHIASNSEDIIDAFYGSYGIPILYFPNIYSPPHYNHPENEECHEQFDKREQKIVDIGCFGAIRPMKNHLNQALAAIIFGNKMKFKIRFHVNDDRCETGGDPVLRNLIHAFKDTNHKLVRNPWMEHKDFIRIVRQMELGLQVSMTETFNIVAADFVWNNIPLIGSDEISWLDRKYKADPNDIESIVDKLHFAYAGRKHDIQKVNFENLEKYNKKSTKIWLNAL